MKVEFNNKLINIQESPENIDPQNSSGFNTNRALNYYLTQTFHSIRRSADRNENQIFNSISPTKNTTQGSNAVRTRCSTKLEEYGPKSYLLDMKALNISLRKVKGIHELDKNEFVKEVNSSEQSKSRSNSTLRKHAFENSQ